MRHTKILVLGLLLFGLSLLAPLVRTPALDNVSSSVVAAPAVHSSGVVPPNILFVLTDDLDAYEVRSMPHLKKLMKKRGVSFSNFFVSSPLCCPSRASILRGQYAQNTGVRDNRPPVGGFETFHALGKEDETIATWLHSAGYRTALIGKYLNGYPQTVNAHYMPPGWDWFISPVDGDAYGEFNYSLNVNGQIVKYGNRPRDYGTDVYARHAQRFIEGSIRNQTPFFLYVASFSPHSPFTPAPRDANRFPRARAPRSPSFDEKDVSDKPSYIRGIRPFSAHIRAEIDESYRRRIQSLQAVDRMLARLIRTLDAQGALDNTFIFFSSDNGYHLGEHRLRAGKGTPYEEALRVPLIVRGPGIRANRTISQLALNTDLAETWLELANVKIEGLDGRSLVPLLLGKSPPQEWRHAFKIEFHASDKETTVKEQTSGILEPPDPGSLLPGAVNRPGVPSFVGLRTDEYKFVQYETGELELYDLRADPYELENRIDSVPRAVIDELTTRVQALDQCAGTSCRELEDLPNVQLP